MTRSLFTSRVIFLLTSLALMCGQDHTASPAPADHSTHVPGEKRQIHGLPNFGAVSPTLFRGAQPSPEGFKELAKMGVSIVVDARGDRADTEGKEVKKLGMQYVPIPWNCPFPRDEVFVKFLKLLRDNPDKKVFVHCRLGDDRTGMMVAAYRMAFQNWTAEEAMAEMQRFGYSGMHHYLICPRLAWYEGSFPEHLKKNGAFQGLYTSPPSAPR